MADLTPETLAAWREDAEDNIHDLCDHAPQCDERILALLDALLAANGERKKAEAREAALRERIEALADEWDKYDFPASTLRAALRALLRRELNQPNR